VEGGDPLGHDLSRVDEFYGYGVRVITLLHYTVNDLGDTGRRAPRNNGLTRFGRRVVERMNELGMVIDVTHADPRTLRDAARISSAPLIDSHTHILPPDLPGWSGPSVSGPGGMWRLWPGPAGLSAPGPWPVPIKTGPAG
jgi:membrane dipeptidase